MNEKLKKRIGMTLAYMGGSPIFLIISAYLTYFYTNVAGLNPGVVGTILLVSRAMPFSQLFDLCSLKRGAG